MPNAETAARARAGKKNPKRKARMSRAQQRIAKAKESGEEPIEKGKVYSLAIFQDRTKLGDWAIAQAEEKGLEIYCVGNKRFITGDEWHRYLEANKPKKAGT